jgi:hypothetical protein
MGIHSGCFHVEDGKKWTSAYSSLHKQSPYDTQTGAYYMSLGKWTWPYATKDIVAGLQFCLSDKGPLDSELAMDFSVSDCEPSVASEDEDDK